MAVTLQSLLLTIFLTVHSVFTVADYKGSQAYNHLTSSNMSVNTATGTFRFSYPLIQASGIHGIFLVHLTYNFDSIGKFGLPMGWELDLDHIQDKTAVLGGQQWLIDPDWHDEHLFASGLKYYNQHGTEFIDAGQERLIPGDDSLSYRYRSQHKDGSENYFSHQGLLVLKQDRFGNRIAIEYEQPTPYIDKARIAAIVDHYGNRFTFLYEPNTIVVKYPDGKEVRIYFNEKGVYAIDDPMQQRYEFSYTNSGKYLLLESISTPSGLLTELKYDNLPYNGNRGRGFLPIVTYFKQSELGSSKVHHETYYRHSKDNNYTGYPYYTLSSSSDSLIESNNQNYRYTVEVKQTDGNQNNPTVHHKVYQYNFLHLPMEINTFKNGKNYITTKFSYPISDFKYNRSTNYDKPSRITQYTWSETKEKYIPSNRVDIQYDVFGNKTREDRWIYHRDEQYWRPIRQIQHQYFTQNYSLLAETVDSDMVTNSTIRTQYTLSPSKKTLNTKSITTLDKINRWQPWKKMEYQYDDRGRETLRQLKWIAKGKPGIQQTLRKSSYLFDSQTKVLTTAHEDSLGHVRQELRDTRNNQLLSKISPLNEKTEYQYNYLGQLIRRTDPRGNVYTLKHFIYSRDGLNATVTESPLGFRKREQKDPSGRTTLREYAIGDHYHVIEEKHYNGFGKVASHKDQYGQVSTYQYDDQMRMIVHSDPWLNKTTFFYNDEDLSLDVYLNGHQHKQIKKTPWQLSTKTIHYPLSPKGSDSGTAVENSIIQNSLHQIISEESALLDTRSGNRHSVIKNTYQYDPSRNKTTIKTAGFGGISLVKKITYDLFKNRYSFVKRQKKDNIRHCHWGYEYYYNANNKLQHVFARSSGNSKRLISSHFYDKSDREVKRKLANGNSITREYLPGGLVKSLSWSRQGKTYQVSHHYDADNRLITVRDSDNQQQQFQYDPKGNLTKLLYPDNQQQSYSYDPAGRVVKQVNVGGRAFTFHYDDKDKGKLSSIYSTSDIENQDADHSVQFTYGKDDNGVNGKLLAIKRALAGVGETNESYRYDAFGRLTQTEVKYGNGTPVLSTRYQFLPRGELIEQQNQTQSVQHITRYNYDALKRLTKETHHQSGTINTAANASLPREIRYHYDGNNNLIKEQRSLLTTGAEETISRHYNALDQLVSIHNEKLNTTQTLTHNALGQITTDHHGNKLHYDDTGLLQSVTTANNQLLVTFHYSPDGMLMRTHTGKNHQQFYYDLNKRALTVVKNHKRYDFIQYQKKYLAALSKEGSNHIFTANQSTAARLGLNKKGHKTAAVYAYEGYGMTKSTNDIGTNPMTDFLWNQEYAEEITGLIYLKKRFYHPELRRFVSPDYLQVDNRYSYADANPIAFVDPMGQMSIAVRRDLTYAAAGIISLLAIFAAAVTIPSAVTALTASTLAAAAAAPTTLMYGLSLIGVQVALDNGETKIAKALQYTGAAIGTVSLLETALAIAPSVGELFGIESRFIARLAKPLRNATANVNSESISMSDLSTPRTSNLMNNEQWTPDSNTNRVAAFQSDPETSSIASSVDDLIYPRPKGPTTSTFETTELKSPEAPPEDHTYETIDSLLHDTLSAERQYDYVMVSEESALLNPRQSINVNQDVAKWSAYFNQETNHLLLIIE